MAPPVIVGRIFFKIYLIVYSLKGRATQRGEGRQRDSKSESKKERVRSGDSIQVSHGSAGTQLLK